MRNAKQPSSVSRRVSLNLEAEAMQSGHRPGFKPPGFTERLRALWEAERQRTEAATGRPISQIDWAIAAGLKPLPAPE
jgi:hypothetical protein